MPVSTLELFSSLLDGFLPQLRPMEMEGCPIRFCTGLVPVPAGIRPSETRGRAWVPAGGQGDSMAAAATSCLGEMAERLSLFRVLDGHDPRIFKDAEARPELPAGQFFGFSAAQEARLLERYFSGFEAAGKRVDWNGLAPERVAACNLKTETVAQLPAYGVLLQPLDHEGVVDFGSTVGTAVYSSFEEAQQRATWELVERDAFAPGMVQPHVDKSGSRGGICTIFVQFFDGLSVWTGSSDPSFQGPDRSCRPCCGCCFF